MGYNSPALRIPKNRAILESGQHIVIGVFPTKDSEVKTYFAYTVGMFRELGYELLVFALPLELAAVLNGIAEVYLTGFLKGGASRPPLNVSDDRWANLPAQFCETDPDKVRRFVVQADVFAETEVPVLQVVLPDASGLFPGDEDFDHEMMDPLQPVLTKEDA